MTMDLLKVLVEAEPKQPDIASLAAAVPNATVRPHDNRTVDWGHAVDVATAQLEKSWVRPDTTGHMLASGLADELAATLCAYGMVAPEIARTPEQGTAPKPDGVAAPE